MSYQEKKQIVSLLGSLLVFVFYCLYVFEKFPQATLDTAATFSFWASVILILIPVSIVAKIMISIVFNIIYRIATKEKEPSFADELDKIIELKSTRNSHYVFVIGFLLAMVSLVMDMPPYMMFIIFIFSGLMSEVISVITQIYLYRRGV